MGLFNKGSKEPKDKKKKKESTGKVKGGAQKKAGKQKKKSPIAYMALEPFVELVFGDSGIVREHNGEEVGVILILPFDEIGGLTTSKEDRKNAKKGRFVQAINKGDIETYYDEELDADEKIAIYADDDSILTLNDFSILEDATYHWGYITREGEITDLETTVTMDELSSNEGELEDLFKQANDLDDNEDEDDADDETGTSNFSMPTSDDAEDNAMSGLSGLSGLAGLTPQAQEVVEQAQELPSVQENQAYGGDTTYTQPVESQQEYAEQGYDNGYQEFDDANQGYQETQDVPHEYTEPGEPEYVEQPIDDGQVDENFIDQYGDGNVEVNSAEVEKVLEQILFKDDLDLHLPINQFRDAYESAAQANYLNYYENDGSWLTSEVNRMIHQANNDIQQKMQVDSDQLNAQFVRLLNEFAADTSDHFDMKRDNNAFAQEMKQLEQVKSEEQQLTNDAIERQIEEREEEYNRQREARGDEAKQNAMNTFDQQNRDRFDREVADFRNKELKGVQQRHNAEVSDLYARRRKEAQTYFDNKVVVLMSKLGEIYTTVRKEQREYTNRWSDRIMTLLDNNRANDMARVEVLQRQMEQDNRVNVLQEDADNRIKQLTDDYNNTVQLMEQQARTEAETLNNRIAKLEDELKDARQELLHGNNTSTQKITELQERISSLRSELSESRTKANLADERGAELKQRKNEIEAWKKQVDMISDMNSRNKVAFTCIAIVAVVAALLAGILAGAQLF